ncbi:hypothetical protein EYF80_000934 [Liparis tanakae]|uniref:Uncharacterized protein n=1 Tax=Liparis tanakae TaxID=230148 RepID=A0A4Z2JFM0_9TELE|nr:hypothetical protein EYF80_000934 [Liparis tanakae]
MELLLLGWCDTAFSWNGHLSFCSYENLKWRKTDTKDRGQSIEDNERQLGSGENEMKESKQRQSGRFCSPAARPLVGRGRDWDGRSHRLAVLGGPACQRGAMVSHSEVCAAKGTQSWLDARGPPAKVGGPVEDLE